MRLGYIIKDFGLIGLVVIRLAERNKFKRIFNFYNETTK